MAHYDLQATLESGQAFRWYGSGNVWRGVVHRRSVVLEVDDSTLRATCAVPQSDWGWLTGYLRLDDDLPAIVSSFPDDEPMQKAKTLCPGLRLLLQEPWECLASFICSSTKQIIQIRQCIEFLSKRFGDPIPAAPGWSFPGPVAHAFPTPAQLLAAGEEALRACKVGFRARYLMAAARLIDEGALDLHAIAGLDTAAARAALTTIPGVGPKIADCVLLFGYGRQDAFPIDVWVLRALSKLYFPGRRPTAHRLRIFADTHFGPYGGYAQQYLFHHVRTQRVDLHGRAKAPKAKRKVGQKQA
jgi:N-glycosylase/DNA lyase